MAVGEPIRLSRRAGGGRPTRRAPTGGVVCTMRRLVDAPGEEPLELLAILVQHADRRVPGARQLDRHREKLVQDGFGVQLRDQRPADIEQPPRSHTVHEGNLLAGR